MSSVPVVGRKERQTQIRRRNPQETPPHFRIRRLQPSGGCNGCICHRRKTDHFCPHTTSQGRKLFRSDWRPSPHGYGNGEERATARHADADRVKPETETGIRSLHDSEYKSVIERAGRPELRKFWPCLVSERYEGEF